MLYKEFTSFDHTVDVKNKGGTKEFTVTPAMAEGIWRAHANIFLENENQIKRDAPCWLRILKENENTIYKIAQTKMQKASK